MTAFAQGDSNAQASDPKLEIHAGTGASGRSLHVRDQSRRREQVTLAAVYRAPFAMYSPAAVETEAHYPSALLPKFFSLRIWADEIREIPGLDRNEAR